MLSFSPAVGYATEQYAQSVVVADFNGDSRLDLAVLNLQSSKISVLRGNGDGTFQSAVNYATGAGAHSLAVGDFNADNRPDLATANDSGVGVLLNDGSGAFGASASFSIPNSPLSVAVGDFNADGKLDLVATSSFSQPGSWGWYGYYPGYDVSSATVLLGNGAGSFTTAGTTQIGSTSFSALAVADFNSDGKSDLAAASADSYALQVLFGTTSGVLSNPSYVPVSGSRSVTAGDVNGDGKADLVTTSSYSNAVYVLLNNGTGGFGAAQYNTGTTPYSAAIADFNGDGKADVVTGNSGDSTVSVLLGQGTGAFQPPINLATSSAPVSIAVGDFNRDGRPDAATANGGANSASVLLNDGLWPALTAPRISISDVTVVEGNTGTVSANFTVSLSASSTQPVTVRFATADGTATAASGDYQAKSGTITFAPGDTSKIISVQVNGDRIAESSESFVVRLTDPTNAFLADGTGAGTITDDEPRISIDYQSSVEGNTGTTAMKFAVYLSSPSDEPVSVNYSVAQGDIQDWYWDYYYNNTQPATSDVDFQAQTGTLTFAPSETTKDITVLVYGDYIAETQEAFLVNLSNATGGEIAWGAAVGYINDDEPYASISDGVTKREGNTGTTAFVYTVTLSAPAGVPLTVNYTTVDGSATASGGDYQAATGAVTFAAGQTSQTITVLVNGDRLPEYDESFSVQLIGSTGANIGAGYSYTTIQDDDPRLSVNSVSKIEGNSGTSILRFTVSLAVAYDEPVTVNFNTANGTAAAGSDYQAKSGMLTFAPNDTFKYVDVVVYGDTTKESDEYFYLQLTVASSNAWIYNGSGLGYIYNDDTKLGNRGGKN